MSVNPKNSTLGEEKKVNPTSDPYWDLPRTISPGILKNQFFDGVHGPRLNLVAIYNLFHRDDFPCIKIGRKYFAPKHLFVKWWENQAGKNLTK